MIKHEFIMYLCTVQNAP